jgi:hypothetical protein
MLTMLKTFIVVWLAIGLCGCVGAAGISTWGYRSGPGYETARAQESRIQVDASRGLTHEACTSVSRRQIAASGEVTEADLSACRSN